MLEFYKYNYYAIIDGEEVMGCGVTSLFDSDKIKEGKNQIETISWDKVDCLKKYQLYYEMRNTKKGRVLKVAEDYYDFCMGKAYKFKEWEDDLNIPIIEECHKIKVSLQKIFDWEDSEKAIQYLNEHGLSINGALK